MDLSSTPPMVVVVVTVAPRLRSTLRRLSRAWRQSGGGTRAFKGSGRRWRTTSSSARKLSMASPSPRFSTATLDPPLLNSSGTSCKISFWNCVSGDGDDDGFLIGRSCTRDVLRRCKLDLCWKVVTLVRSRELWSRPLRAWIRVCSNGEAFV